MTKLAGYFAILCCLLYYHEAYSQREWATYFGGEAEDEITDVASSYYGYCITGITKSQTGIATPNSHQSVYPSSGQNAFLANYFDQSFGGPSLQLYWSTYIGGNGLDKANGVASWWKSIYVVGSTTSTNNIASSGAYQEQLGGLSDGFIMKFNNEGVFQWGTYFGGSERDEIHSVIVDRYSNIYVTGWTESNNGISTQGSFQPTHGGGKDVFLAKFDSTGTLLWSTYFGGPGDEEVTNMDSYEDLSNDYLMIIGNTNSTSGISSIGSHQSSYGGGVSDAFIAKFNPSGTRLWSTYYGGTGEEFGEDVKCDYSSIYFCGATSSLNAIATPGAYLSTGADRSAFLVKLDLSGTREWGTYYRGDGNFNHAYSLIISNFGNWQFVYISGITNSLTGISGPNTIYQGYFGGGITDAFFVRFLSNGLEAGSSYYGGLSPEGGQYGTCMANYFEDYEPFVIAGNSWDSLGVSNHLTTVGSPQPNHAGIVDGFFASFNFTPISLDERDISNTYLFPNPSNGSFTLCNKNQGEIKIEVFDLIGRLVFCEVKEHVSETVIQTSLSPGVYTIQTTGAFQFTERLIISGKN